MGRSNCFFRENLADAANLRADTTQLFFYVFVAAVHVIDAIDDRLTIRYQRSYDQRG